MNSPTLRQLRAEGWGTRKNKYKSKGKIKINYPTLRQLRAEGWGTRIFFLHTSLLLFIFASFYLPANYLPANFLLPCYQTLHCLARTMG